jgi:hypothetical protein
MAVGSIRRAFDTECHKRRKPDEAIKKVELEQFQHDDKSDDYWPASRLINSDEFPRIRVETRDSAPSLLYANDASRFSTVGNLARVATPFVRLAAAPDPDVKLKPKKPTVKRIEDVR